MYSITAVIITVAVKQLTVITREKPTNLAHIPATHSCNPLIFIPHDARWWMWTYKLFKNFTRYTRARFIPSTLSKFNATSLLSDGNRNDSVHMCEMKSILILSNKNLLSSYWISYLNRVGIKFEVSIWRALLKI